MLLSLIKIGEDTGRIDSMLLKAGKIFENELEGKLRKVLNLIEPVIIIFLAFFVGVFIISTLMPIITIMDSIA
jgi:type IV pilus assembly protein PilC